MTIGDWPPPGRISIMPPTFYPKVRFPRCRRTFAVELGAAKSGDSGQLHFAGSRAFLPEVPEAEREPPWPTRWFGLPGRPEHVGHAVLLLENDFVTGVCLPVDGSARSPAVKRNEGLLRQAENGVIATLCHGFGQLCREIRALASGLRLPRKCYKDELFPHPPDGDSSLSASLVDVNGTASIKPTADSRTDCQGSRQRRLSQPAPALLRHLNFQIDSEACVAVADAEACPFDAISLEGPPNWFIARTHHINQVVCKVCARVDVCPL